MPIVRFLPRREGALLDEVWVRPAKVAAIPIVDTDTGGLWLLELLIYNTTWTQ